MRKIAVHAPDDEIYLLSDRKTKQKRLLNDRRPRNPWQSPKSRRKKTFRLTFSLSKLVADYMQKAFELRANAINELRKSKNPDPYPHKFQTTMSVPEFIESFQHLKRGEQLTDKPVALAGRALEKRDASKLIFYDLHGDVRPTRYF